MDNERYRFYGINQEDFYTNPGGARRPIPHEKDYCNNDYKYLVKVDENDPTPNYLGYKLSGSDGIIIEQLVDNHDGTKTLLIKNKGGENYNYSAGQYITIDNENRIISVSGLEQDFLTKSEASGIYAPLGCIDRINAEAENIIMSADSAWNPMYETVKTNSSKWEEAYLGNEYYEGKYISIYKDIENRKYITVSGLTDINDFNELSGDLQSLSGYVDLIENEFHTDYITLSGVVWEIYKNCSGSPYNISAISSYLNNKIDTASSFLYNEIEYTSSYLDNVIQETSSYLQNEIENVSSNIYYDISSVSSYLDNKIDTTSSEIINNISSVSSYLQNEIENVTSSIYDDISSVSSYLDNKIDTTSSELYSEISSVSSYINENEEKWSSHYNYEISSNDPYSINVWKDEIEEGSYQFNISSKRIDTDETLSGDGIESSLGLNGGVVGLSAGEGIDIEEKDGNLVISSIFNGVSSDDTLSGNGADIPLGLNGGDIGLSAGEGIKFEEINDSVVISTIFNGVATDDTLSGDGADIPLGLNGGLMGISAGEGMKIENVDDTLVFSTIFNGVLTDDTLSGDGANEPLGLNGGDIELSAGEGIEITEDGDTLVIASIFNGVVTDGTLSGNGADEPLGLNNGTIYLSAGYGIDIDESDNNVIISSTFSGSITDDTLSGDGINDPIGLNGGAIDLIAGKGIELNITDTQVVISTSSDYISSVNVDDTLSGNGVEEPIGLNGGVVGLSAGEGIDIQLVGNTLVVSSIVQPKTTLIVNGFATNNSETLVTSDHISASKPNDMNGQWLFYFDKPMTTEMYIEAKFVPDSEKYIDHYDTVGFNVNNQTNYTMFGFAPQTFSTTTTMNIPTLNGEIYTLPLSLNLGTSGFITEVLEPRIAIKEL